MMKNIGGHLLYWIIKLRFVILILLIISTILMMNAQWFGKLLYPLHYREAISQAAKQYEVDPMLIAAIIRVESKFKKQDVSHAGAIGLMQLMPTTAQWIAKQSQIPYKAQAELSESTINIRLGSWYVKYLQKRFSGHQAAAVAAYNAGPTRVERWIQKGIWNGSYLTSQDIPVGETRHFVSRVYFSYQMYRKYYG